jgi:Ca-activated chloride channel family protein
MNFANPHFAEPAWLWFAVLGPALLAALHGYSARERRRQLAQLVAPPFTGELTRSHSPGRRALKHTLLLLSVAGIGLALARPQWGELEEAGESLGEDLVFVLDCSRSMLAADVTPNRLQRAKLAVLDFLRRYARGRVGLVAFAGQAFIQCPLTSDYGAFEEALAALDEKTIPVAGTDIGRALDEASQAMEKNDQHKLMVLLTDGEDLEKNGVRTAEGLAAKGIVVFTLGVGTPAGTEIQVVNEKGQPEQVRDSKGEIVKSSLDETTLRSIAQATHGAYYPLGPVGEGLAKVRAAAETMNLTGGSAPARKRAVDRFHLPVAVALVLLVVESLIGTRRRAGALAARAGAAALLVCSVSSLSAATNTNTTFAGAPAAASEPAPVTPRDFFNAGTRRLREGRLREAETLLQTAVAGQAESLQPTALYNLGHTRFADGLEALKKSPDGRQATARAQQTASWADAAIRMADAALAGNDVQQMLAAYQRGRGVRKELNAANEAVRRAMEAYGTVLMKWRRASGDFRSAVELQSPYADAQYNADVVDRHIAELVDRLQQMQQTCTAPCDKCRELGQKLKELKGRIPASMMPPGSAGDDEEEDYPPEPQAGQQEAPSKEGREMSLSPEEAARLLDGFKLDAERRLPLGESNTPPPKGRPRPDW